MYAVWHDPLMSTGKNTFANDLIEIAGGENIYSDMEIQYPTISLESVIDRNPDIIIASVGHGDAKNLTYDYIMNEPRLKDVNAVKNKRVYEIDADIMNRPGPRIFDALEQFAVWMRE
jgi:iron complex transport system substrate-binding protein